MISQTDLMWWCSLNQAAALTKIRAVCDLGLQELHASNPTTFAHVSKRFVELCGRPDVDLSGCGTSAEMWRLLGREHVSLDLYGADPGLVRFDLNTDSVYGRMRGHFDFVTNVGTSEHVLNQLNVLRVMHDLTRLGGVMVHAAPAVGYCNHGYINYNVKLFTQLCKYNNYDCLDAWMSISDQVSEMAADVRAFLRGSDVSFEAVRSVSEHPFVFYGDLTSRYQVPDGSLYVFLRRTSAAPFVVPMDVPDAHQNKDEPRVIRLMPRSSVKRN